MIVQQERPEFNQDDPFIEFTHNHRQIPYQPFKTRINLKKILSIAAILTFCIFCTFFLKIFFQNRLSRLKMRYFQETVGIPIIGTEFNFTEVSQNEKYRFQTLLAGNLQPFNSTNCLLQNIEGTLICKNFIKESKGFMNFATQMESSHLDCELTEKYDIPTYFYGCKVRVSEECESIVRNSNNWCLSEVSQTIFFTDYKSMNEILQESKLESQHKIIKMSLHQSELASFRSFSPKKLQFVDQLILQFHMQEAYIWGNLDIISSLVSSFYPVALHMDSKHCRPDDLIESGLRKFQSSVFTVTLVNKNILQLTAKTRSFWSNQIFKGINGQKGCQMPQRMHQVVVQHIEIQQIPENQENLHQLTLQHVHQKVVYDQPTMGMPKPLTNFNFQKIKQNDRIAYYNYIADIFKPFNDTDCQYARYGDTNDQGYVICKNIVNLSVALLNFGIQGKDSFGCEISSQFNIPNLQYDCTDRKRPFCRTNNNENHFYFACVAQRSQYIPKLNRTLYSLKDIIDRHKLIGKHITLKIDVEASEWVSFRSLPTSYLDNIDQIIIEFHLFENFGYFNGNYEILDVLEKKFYSVNFHQNNYNCWRHSTSKLRSTVFQVTLVNKNVLKLISNSRSYFPNDLNKANRKNSQDCQMTLSD